MDGNVVEKSVLEGPNGEFIFNMVENVTDYEKTNTVIREDHDGFTKDRSRRMNVSIPPRLYYFHARIHGTEEIWLDKAFLKSFMKEHPEYATCKGGI